MKKRILVLRGGPSSENEVSLKTGRSVIETLKEDHQVTDCTVDRNSDWFVSGFKVAPQHIVKNHDLVFNALHGEYGEDGQVQRLLDGLSVRYTGPKTLGASLSMNKVMAKKLYKDIGLKTPIHLIIEKKDDLDKMAIEIFRSFPMPVVLKPIDRGSSVGVTLARDYQSLHDTLISLFVHYDKLLVEEYIAGKEATVGVIEEFRQTPHYALLPIEIKKNNQVFDYQTKYGKEVSHVCPGNFSSDEKALLQEVAVKAHQILNLRHYSRSDFIVHPKRGVYLLETNSLPGLTEYSLLPKAVQAVGLSYKDFLNHIIDLA